MERSSQETNESHKLLSALCAIHNDSPDKSPFEDTFWQIIFQIHFRNTFPLKKKQNQKNPKYMSVEKNYFRQTVVCQKKQRNSLDNTLSLSHLLHFRDVDSAAPVAPSPQSIFSTLLCTFNAWKTELSWFQNLAFSCLATTAMEVGCTIFIL